MLGMAAVSLALVTRYLGPERYGEYALAIAYVSLFGVLADIGLFTILVREISRREDETGRLVGNVLVLRLALGFGTVALAAAISLALPYTSQTRWAVLIYAVPFLLGLANTAYVAIFQARLRMERAVVGDVAGRAAALAALVAVVVADLGFYAVVGTAAVGGVVALACSLVLARSLARVRPRLEPGVWGGLLRASLPLGIAFAVTEVYFRVDLFIIGLLRPVADVGLYGLAYRIFELLAIFSTIVMASVFPLLSRREGDRRRVLQATADLFLVTGVPLAAGGAVLAPGIVSLIGGPEFAGATEAMRLLLVAAALAYLNGLLGYALIARDRQRDLLYLNVGALTLNVALNLALVGRFGIVAAAWVMIVCELAILAGSYVLMRRHYGYFPSLAVGLRAGLAALVMVAAIWPLRSGPVIAVTALGVVLYGAVLFLVGGVDRDLLRRIRTG